MKFPAICVAALLATSASAESHEYRVLFGGDDVGGLEVETDGDTSFDNIVETAVDTGFDIRVETCGDTTVDTGVSDTILLME